MNRREHFRQFLIKHCFRFAIADSVYIYAKSFIWLSTSLFPRQRLNHTQRVYPTQWLPGQIPGTVSPPHPQPPRRKCISLENRASPSKASYPLPRSSDPNRRSFARFGSIASACQGRSQSPRKELCNYTFCFLRSLDVRSPKCHKFLSFVVSTRLFCAPIQDLMRSASVQ